MDSPVSSWSLYQEAIFNEGRHGTGNVIIVAVAGSGKTTTIAELVKRLTGSTIFLAFGKANAEDLKARGVNARTFHSLTYGPVTRACKARNVATDKLRTLVTNSLSGEDARMYGAFITRLVGLARNAGVGCLVEDTEQAWADLIEHHALELESETATYARAVQLARKLLETSNTAAQRDGLVDFDDLLYLAVKDGISLPKFDHVLVDECFLAETPILMDLRGKVRTIQELYESNYRGPIVSWSKERGTHLQRVTAVKRIPVGKPLVQVKIAPIAYGKEGRRLARDTAANEYGPSRILICTEDHKIWTEKGWVRAGQLKPGTIVKQETLVRRQPIVRRYQDLYKHTEEGKRKLALSPHLETVTSYVPKKGTWTGTQGGNGRGPTRHEAFLLERLGKEGWEMQAVLRTGQGCRTVGLPTHYKVDLLNHELRIAVEVDGAAHTSARVVAADKKKEMWLTKGGWKVVRIKNHEVISLTEEELHSRIYGSCPIEAEVVSVLPWTNRDHFYVYDLTVANTHCYFANGVLAHNCQDTNGIQRAILRKIMHGGSRLYAVGDPCQAIFGFRGADSDSMRLIKEEFGAKQMPLTVSYRCPQAVVRFAQQWVSHIEAAPTAPEGEVHSLGLFWKATAEYFRPGNLVVCRTTAPIVTLAYQLLKARVPAHILGRDIGQGLITLVNKMKARGLEHLIQKLDAYTQREVEKAVAKKQDAKAEAIQDKTDAVLFLIDSLDENHRTIPALVQLLETLFSDQNNAVRLCTIHKAKGLEAPTVYWLNSSKCPAKWARQPWQQEQERNLCYVAATRAKERLVLIEFPDERKGR